MKSYTTAYAKKYNWIVYWIWMGKSKKENGGNLGDCDLYKAAFSQSQLFILAKIRTTPLIRTFYFYISFYLIFIFDKYLTMVGGVG